MRKFTCTLNGVKVEKEIPTSWDEVSFKTYLALVDVQGDSTGVLSVFTGIEADTLKKVRIVGLEDVLFAIAFVNIPPRNDIPKTILGFQVPKDLNFETTGQFKDCQAIVQSFKPEGENLSKEDQLKYLDIVAIYAMPNYFEASVEQQKEFAQKFLEAPCGEVLAIGNFTLLKLIGWNLNIKPDSLSRIGPVKKLRLAIRIWLKNMAFSLRYAWLKRKLA